ncbi:MAG TPA: M56 family metallopeptidase, partial [Gemmataceae bacterium]
ESDPPWSAWSVVAAVFLAGVAWELARLAVGVIAVAAVRRRSVAVTEPHVAGEADELRRALGVRAPVAVRQSGAVGTAATVGWRRPVILLAADWPTWDAAERRAVLAHELAHVRRRDYPLALAAAACRAAHFYHPLVRRLAGRLRLSQELAADALAAAVAGGREMYLRALARLALRQDAALVAGAARPFLSDRGSLLRRVAMLRVTDDARPLGRAVQWGMAVVLIAAALAASAVRGPAQESAGAKPQGGEVAGDLPPFDLSYIPPTSAGFVAIRPAALLSRPEMKPVLEQWGRLFKAQCKAAGLGPAFDIPFDAIEQVVGPFEFKTYTEEERKKNPNGEGHAVVMGLSLIRMNRDFDWPGTLKALAPLVTVTEVKPGAFECRGEVFGPQTMTVHVIDRRTLVLAPVPGGALSRRDDSAARWGPAWKAVERAVAVQVHDNSDGRWTESLAHDQAAAKVLGVLGRPVHLAFGLSGGESVAVTGAADYAEEPADAAVVSGAEALRRIMRDQFKGGPEPGAATDRILFGLADEFTKSFTVRRAGKLVTAEARLTTKWVDLLRAMTPGEDSDVAPKVEVQERKP